MVTSESPCLAGSGQVVGKGTSENENSRDGVESNNTARTDSLGEDPDVRVARSIVQGGIKVSDHEHVTDQEDKTKETVHEVGVDHSPGHSLSGVLDLLSQVSNTIRTDTGVDGRDLTNHKGQTSRVPATAIGNLGEGHLSGVPGVEGPEDDNDGKEAKNVNHQHDVLEQRHSLGAVHVQCPHQNGDGNDYECTLPVGGRVVRVHDSG